MANYRLGDLLFKALLPAKVIKAMIDDTPVYHEWGHSERNRTLKSDQELGRSQKAPESDPNITRNYITLLDLDNNLSNELPTKTYDYITLPVVPLEVTYDPDPQWATIASLGRNAPFYNYSGSEDTLSFQIDWYSLTDNRQDVLYACRWVEALTKSNAYGQDPHRIRLIWGMEDKLFEKDIWIVHKASYKMSQFQKHRSMLPQQAYQEIVLKKVLVENSNIANVFGSAFNGFNYYSQLR